MRTRRRKGNKKSYKVRGHLREGEEGSAAKENTVKCDGGGGEEKEGEATEQAERKAS